MENKTKTNLLLHHHHRKKSFSKSICIVKAVLVKLGGALKALKVLGFFFFFFGTESVCDIFSI